MIRIYDSNPEVPNFACDSAKSIVAQRPFSGCADCQFMSGMSCTANEQNFAHFPKKALHFV